MNLIESLFRIAIPFPFRPGAMVAVDPPVDADCVANPEIPHSVEPERSSAGLLLVECLRGYSRPHGASCRAFVDHREAQAYFDVAMIASQLF